MEKKQVTVKLEETNKSESFKQRRPKDLKVNESAGPKSDIAKCIDNYMTLQITADNLKGKVSRAPKRNGRFRAHSSIFESARSTYTSSIPYENLIQGRLRARNLSSHHHTVESKSHNMVEKVSQRIAMTPLGSIVGLQSFQV